MKTAPNKPRLSNNGKRMGRPPLPAPRPVITFRVDNFVNGRTICYEFARDGYSFTVEGHKTVKTDATTYPQVAAIARRKHGLPPIGCASYAKGIAA